MPDLSQGQQDAAERIADLLRELADLVGPTADPLDDDAPVGAVLLNEWTLVASWVDSEGSNFVSLASPPAMPEYHRVGLLSTAMDW